MGPEKGVVSSHSMTPVRAFQLNVTLSTRTVRRSNKGLIPKAARTGG